jgi:hypothetical protein
VPGQAGRDDERPARRRERLPEHVEGAPVGGCRRREVPREGHVVLEGEVDDAVRTGSGGTEDLEIVERAADHLGPGLRDRCGGRVRTSEADDLVPGLEELRDHRRTDPATGSGHEHAHEISCRPA